MGMGTVRFPRLQNHCHAIWRFRVPYDRIPIRRNKNRPAAWLQNAERLGKSAVDVGDVLCDLRAYNAGFLRRRALSFVSACVLACPAALLGLHKASCDR